LSYSTPRLACRAGAKAPRTSGIRIGVTLEREQAEGGRAFRESPQERRSPVQRRSLIPGRAERKRPRHRGMPPDGRTYGPRIRDDATCRHHTVRHNDDHVSRTRRQGPQRPGHGHSDRPMPPMRRKARARSRGKRRAEGRRFFSRRCAWEAILASRMPFRPLGHEICGHGPLLLNAEGVFAALIAWFVFRENFGRRIASGMPLIFAGATVLSWPRRGRLRRGVARPGRPWRGRSTTTSLAKWRWPTPRSSRWRRAWSREPSTSRVRWRRDRPCHRPASPVAPRSWDSSANGPRE